MKKQLYSTLALLVCLATAAHAALSVGGTGTGTLDFGVRPTIATGWSTLSSGASAAGTVTDPASMDTYISPIAASTITTELGESTSYPPTTQGIARWNDNATSGFFIQTRPTGNTVTLLMCTLLNESGATVSTVDIAYDLGALVSSDSTIVESLYGLRVYWSLTGAAGSWTPIESLSTGTAGHLTANIDLGAWASGASLYLLWADDNGPSSDTAPNKEGAYTIDNFSVTPGNGTGELLVALNHPDTYIVQRCSTATYTALATGGARPYAYTWYKDGAPLGEPSTDASLVINNAQETDNGRYMVVVTDSTPVNPAMTFSPESVLTITSDNAVPVLLSADSSGGTTVTLAFSKPISISSAAGADFSITAVNGGAVLPIASAVIANGTNVVLTTGSQLGGAKYQVAIQGSGVTDACNGSAVTGSLPILDRFTILGIDATHMWRYDTNGVDLGTAWKEVSYPEDVNWPEGAAVLDAKSTPRTTVGGQTVRTQLPLTNPNSQFGTANLPTYYFRTHVAFPANADPAATMVSMRAMFDDGIVVYVNGTEVYHSPLITNGVNDAFASYLGGTVGDAALTAPITLNASSFLEGDNVVAVYLKQGNNGSSDSTMALEIDVTVTNWFITGGPLVATASPASVSIPQCGSFSLTGTSSGGTRPHSFQWFNGSTALTDGNGISGATTLNLSVNNAQPANAGNYHLRVTDATSATANSPVVPVTVVADTAPTLVSAVGQVDLHTLVVTFNKPVNISGGNFQVLSTEGGLSLTVTSSVVSGAVVTLQTAQPREARNYNVVVGAGVTGTCSGLAVTTGSLLKIVSHMPIFGLNVNNEWQYNQAGVDLGTGWLVNTYNDHDTAAGWATGNALFAGDRDAVPATINGEPVNTTLAMTNSTTIYNNTGNVIPTYYFRKHFTPPTALANMTLACRTFFDDYGILYINGQEAWRNTNIVATNELFDMYLRLNTVGTADYSGVIPLPKDNVVQGDNVFSVYLKQGTPGSSDIAMGLELIAIVTDFAPVVVGPRLTITKNGNNVTISWTPATGTLQEATALGSWSNSSVANGGTVPATGKKFFRLAP